jgi:hypothetical protein
MILGEAAGSALHCLSPAKRDEFSGRPEQALEASKYAAADERNLALCRTINALLSKRISRSFFDLASKLSISCSGNSWGQHVNQFVYCIDGHSISHSHILVKKRKPAVVRIGG